MNIEVIKSHDMWEEGCTGWFDLYKVDQYFIYPLSDWWDNDEVPDELLSRLEQTLDGSKLDFFEMIKSIYFDLFEVGKKGLDYDIWRNTTDGVSNLEKELKDKLNVSISIVSHNKRYNDSLIVLKQRRSVTTKESL